MKRIDPYRIVVEQSGAMKQQALIFASSKIRVEDNAVRQLINAASIDPGAVVLATPDIHTGFGVPIGCVFASQQYISPSAVGYDINCGMRMITTPCSRDDLDLAALAQAIRHEIPLGEGKKNIPVSPAVLDAVLKAGLSAVPGIAADNRRVDALFDDREFQRDCSCTEDSGSLDGVPRAVSQKAKQRGHSQLATLGGGNHFIEIQEVTSILNPVLAAAFSIRLGQITVMVHSGSRGFGHQVAGDYMRIALEWDQTYNQFLPDRDLAYLPADSPQGKQYAGAMNAAANFAFVNRLLMTMLVRKCFRSVVSPGLVLPSVYDVPHNIAKYESHRGRNYWVHRKGATRAFPPAKMSGTPFSSTGQPVLIPGSMGTASYLLAGLPTGAESLYSVNHGAGRVMSRSEATGRSRRGKKVREAAVSDREFSKSMAGVFLLCEDRRSIKEEAPAAYKDIDEVIAVVTGAGLATAVARMQPLAVLKG